MSDIEAEFGPCVGGCSFCGLELYGDTDPPARMRAHALTCPDHPMRAVEGQVTRLLSACNEALQDLRLWTRDHTARCTCATCTITIPKLEAALATPESPP